MMTLRFRHRLIAGAAIATLLAAMPAGAGAAPASQESVPAVKVPAVETTAPAPGSEASEAQAPEGRLTQEEALAKVKEFFPIPDEKPNVQIDAYLNQNGDRAVWDFSVNIQFANMGYGYSLASVDARTGRILQYTGTQPYYGKIQTGPLPPAKPEEDARTAAWQLVQRLYPDVAPTLKPSTDPNAYIYYGYPDQLDNSYHFGWQEYRNGVPVPSSQVAVAVDRATLAPTQVNYNLMDGLTYPEAKPAVTDEQAMKMVREQVEPRLFYLPKQEMITPYGSSQPREFQLVWQFENAYRQVDALTGQFFDPIDGPRPAGKPEAVPDGRVTPVVPAGPLTEAEATRVAELILEVPKDGRLMLDRGMSSEPGISVRLQPTGPDQPYGQVFFDGQTGMVRNAYRNVARSSPGPTQKPAELTPAMEAKALEAAMAVVQQYYSQVRTQLRYVPNSNAPYISTGSNPSRFYHFQRYVNGVQVGNDGVSVTIDLQTMTWRGFSMNWTTGVAFPAIEGLISPDKAMESFFAGRKMELVYWPVRKRAPTPSRMGPYLPPTEAALIYRLAGQGPGMLDARTGAPVAYDGESLDSLEAAAKKVAGHAAEGELRYMLATRILRPAELNPFAPITRVKAVQMLLAANENGVMETNQPLPFTDVKPADTAYNLVLQAYRTGWLLPSGEAKEFRPNDSVTRAEFAVWAVRALGYGNLARSPISVKSGYTDLDGLTAEERNAAGFLEALGLIPQAEKFRGHEAITQAEAAALTARIYNALRDR